MQSTANLTSKVSNKPAVALLLPSDTRAKILSEEAEERLASVATVVVPKDDQLTSENLPALLDGVTATLTGWGTPSFSNAVLAEAPALTFIAHAAGSIHHFDLGDSIENGRIRISHAAALIADAVAEFVLAQCLSHLRSPMMQDADLKAGREWFDVRASHLGRLLGAQTVGVVGAGYVGRLVISLLRAFGASVLAYDPYLSLELAEDLGVELRTLDDVFASSDIITLHAPVLPETLRMIGAGQLAKLRDGALFINTARATLVDEDAFTEALRQGRFTAAIDVFEREPLPDDSPLRSLPNVRLSPHSAGHTTDTYLRQGRASVGEIERFLKGERLQYEVTQDMLTTMA